TEPYRMFTSRAEYRLRLRADNADRRLTGKGCKIGLIGERRRTLFAQKEASISHGRSLLENLTLTPTAAARVGLPLNQDGVPRTAFQLLCLDGVTLARLGAIWPELRGWEPKVGEQLEIDAAYAPYLARQEADIKAYRQEEELELPRDLDFDGIGGLSTEVRSKLAAVRPATLGQAGRIPGITPAALTALLGHIRRRERRRA
ncbi:MAG: tRNA uridine-5-carboxymethylaminomethyl(34) synthesis enzyme MnmG, partial [Alphaproteobacteria bacterium]|nr:tRNA uridine-5-carboxymethylaminomethyl(34) synthesis enzyme MnmG [Alphaproteobacteria bacterium]